MAPVLSNSGRADQFSRWRSASRVSALADQDRRIRYQQLEKSVGIGSAATNTIINGKLKAAFNIITGEETWIYNFYPRTKRQSTPWCSSKSPPPKKVHRAQSVGKQMVAKQSRPRAQLRGVLLHRDNAGPHTSAQTLDFLANSGVQLVTLPPYSPDLAPWGIKFDTDDGALQAFINAVNSIPEDDWCKCFDNWFSRMKSCKGAKGEYFKKLLKF
ncbi:hypothetical protein LAZ67_X001856 [Cordylochernes scorpioides]|uniref:Transposase n=1 Tax=Cordylochernes scorpioides TaxID=51811 RepID=A0ABY6LWZ4_9ARAC|nr:hypothetical protein LAZ67_X001856 [Cordylochernes scorpioides]